MFTRNVSIDKNAYSEFLKKGNFNIATIRLFAKSQNVHPGIVIGRMQKDLEDYTFLSSYQERYKWELIV